MKPRRAVQLLITTWDLAIRMFHFKLLLSSGVDSPGTDSPGTDSPGMDSPGMDSHSLHLCLHSRLSTLTIHMLLHFMDTILVSRYGHRTTRQVHPIIMDSITVSKYGNKTTQQVHPMKVVEMEVRVISWHLVI